MLFYRIRESNRLNLLAGLIDSDGYKADTNYEITQVRKELAEQIAVLARSLGFYVHLKKKRTSIASTGFVGEAYRMSICGDVWRIPVLVERKKIPEASRVKNTLLTGIKVTKLEVDDYYGFTIDRDHLFCLADFTVTHNTEWLNFLASELGEPLHTVDVGTIQDAQSAMVGVHRLDHEQKSVFDPAPFVHYIQSGNPILLDEVNRGPLATQNMLFPCLDKRRYLPVDIAGEGEERHIKVHEKTWFAGTANLGAEYGGTQTLDWAFKQRFHVVELTYMEECHEIAMLVLRTGIDRPQARTIVQLAGWTRAEVQDNGLGVAMSTRHTMETAEMVVDGFTLHEAIESVVYPLYDNDGPDSEREKLRLQVAQY